MMPLEVIPATNALVYGLLVWIPLFFWVLSLLQWMIMLEIDWAVGLIGIFVGIALGVITASPPHPSLPPYTFSAVVLTVLCFPFVRNIVVNRQTRSNGADQISEYYEGLRTRPDNWPMQFKLAEGLWRLGLAGHAIRVAEEALSHMPQIHFLPEHNVLKKWHKRSPGADHFGPALCQKCGHSNPTGTLFCAKCSHAVLLDYARGRWLGEGMGRALILGWVVLMIAVVGIPYAAHALPPALATLIVLIILMLAVSVLGWVVLSLRRKQP